MKGLKKLYPVIGSIVMFVAVFGGVNAASFFSVYQPKVPKCLK